MSGEAMEVKEPSARYLAKADEADVPVGYKRSDVGVIPEDWNVRTLGELCTQIVDGTHFTPRYVPDGVPFYSVENVTADDFANVKYISKKEHDVLIRRCRPTRGDILLTRIGSLGDTKLIDWDVDASIYVSLALLKLGERADPNYVYRYTQSSQFVRDVESRSLVNATPKKINMGDIGAIPVPTPPTALEQRAIAEVLSDVDGLLGALEALIAKKRAIKQAAVQQLLTGKTRLPGFSGEWETKRLGDHVTFLRHGVNSRAELTTDSSVKYLHYGDIHTTSDVYLDPCASQMPRLPTDRARTLDRLQDGDLVLVDASEDLGGVGKSVEIKGTRSEEVVSGLHTIAARFDKSVLADGFKAYLLFCPAFRNHLRRLAAGTKVYATNRAHIATAEMPLPDVEEQTAIASVLSDMGAEIAALEGRRGKTRAIKQGMMQQLLTGKIRLV